MLSTPLGNYLGQEALIHRFIRMLSFPNEGKSYRNPESIFWILLTHFTPNARVAFVSPVSFQMHIAIYLSPTRSTPSWRADLHET